MEKGLYVYTCDVPSTNIYVYTSMDRDSGTMCMRGREREGGHVLPVRQASSFLRTGSSFDAVRSLPG